LFLRELSRDCGDRAVLARLWWLIGSAAGFGCLAVVTGSLADLAPLRPLVLFAGLLVSGVHLIRLVLAARAVAARQMRSSIDAVQRNFVLVPADEKVDSG